jgi:hypothetical protein
LNIEIFDDENIRKGFAMTNIINPTVLIALFMVVGILLAACCSPDKEESEKDTVPANEMFDKLNENGNGE